MAFKRPNFNQKRPIFAKYHVLHQNVNTLVPKATSNEHNVLKQLGHPPEQPMKSNSEVVEGLKALEASENHAKKVDVAVSRDTAKSMVYETHEQLLEIRKASSTAWERCLAAKNVTGTKRRATFNDALENIQAKKALMDKIQVFEASFHLCSLNERDSKPTFVSPFYNDVVAQVNHGNDVVRVGGDGEEAYSDRVVPCDGLVGAESCQVSDLVKSARPLCTNMPTAMLTPAIAEVQIPASTPLESSDVVIGCDGNDGPMGASHDSKF